MKCIHMHFPCGQFKHLHLSYLTTWLKEKCKTKSNNRIKGMKAVSGENKSKAALKSTQTIYHQKTIEIKADCA